MLKCGEDVFFLEDEILGVVNFDVSSGILFEDYFVAFFDVFNIGADAFDGGVGRGFFGVAEKDARSGLLEGFFLFSNDTI